MAGILGFARKKKKKQPTVTTDEIAANATDPGGNRAIQGTGMFDAMASGLGGLFGGTANAAEGPTQFKRTGGGAPAQVGGFDIGGLLGGIGGAIGGAVGGVRDWAKENPEMFTGLATGLIGTTGGSGLSGLQSFGAGGAVAGQMGQQRAANELAMAKAQAAGQGDMTKPFGAEQAKIIASSVAAGQALDVLTQGYAGKDRGTINPFDIGTKRVRNASKQIAEELGRMQSGGAISEDELKNFKSLIPTRYDSDEVAADKLKSLRTKIQGRAALVDPTGRGRSMLSSKSNTGGSQGARAYLQ